MSSIISLAYIIVISTCVFKDGNVQVLGFTQPLLCNGLSRMGTYFIGNSLFVLLVPYCLLSSILIAIIHGSLKPFSLSIFAVSNVTSSSVMAIYLLLLYTPITPLNILSQVRKHSTRFVFQSQTLAFLHIR